MNQSLNSYFHRPVRKSASEGRAGRGLAVALAAALAFAAPVGAADRPATEALLEAAFGASLDGQVATLEPSALEDTRGEFGPAAFIFGVAGMDLALSAFFWGVYIPTYAGGAGSCSACMVPLYIAR